MRTQPNTVNDKSILFYLLLLTGFFLLAEVSFFIQCNEAYFSDFTFVSNQIHIPTSIIPSILFFIAAQLFLHLSYCILVWISTISISRLVNLNDANQFRLAIGLWLLGITTVLVANYLDFPNSKIAVFLSVLLNQWIATQLFLILKMAVAIAILLTILQIIKRHGYISLSVILCGLIFYKINNDYTATIPYVVHDAATEQQPNIIIIGVDSLRPDYLSFFGGEQDTPFFDGLLNRSTVFAEAVTPLARTYPSWVGILTGNYPLQVNIRSNLADQRLATQFAESMPFALRKLGYETIYATDETRFSNISTNLGFDRIVTPPMGLLDFLLGTFNDFPISNLIVNTALGHWLFPYSYANRPVYATYEPASFLKLIEPVLQKPRNKPIFLAVHFCLPHYPYLYATLPGDRIEGRERYQASILAVDRQLAEFYIMLRKSNLLHHAIVVLLSDHGETLEMTGDRITEADLYTNKPPAPHFYPASDYPETVDQSAGHGTDVLGLPQYHSLLAFTLYGEGKFQRTTVPGVVSLLDIKPTIMNLITGEHSDKSLVPVIRDKKAVVPKGQHIFLESDYSPSSIRTVYPETQKVLLEGVQLFEIDPKTLHLTVKNKMNQMIIASKQYADIYQGWMLALYPQNKTQRMPVLVNLETGQWTNDLTSPLAKQSPANEMLLALKAFYGNEISDASV